MLEKLTTALMLYIGVLGLSNRLYGENRENSESVIRDNIEYRIQIDKNVYPLGMPVEMNYKVTNLRDEPVDFNFTSSQKEDFSVEKKIGENFSEIWRWSWDKAFLAYPERISLNSNESREFNQTWPQIDGEGTGSIKDDDSSATIGNYKIFGFLPHNYETTSRIGVEMEIADFFPLQIGNFWEYNNFWRRDNISVIRETISGTEQIENKTYFIFSPPYRMDARLMKLQQNDIQIIAHDGLEKVLYKFSAPENETWSINDWTVKITNRNETVSVPAGTFENTIRIEFRRNVADAGYIIEWFAPNTGCVRRVKDSFAGPSTSELINAHINGVYIPPRNSAGKSWILYE